MCGCQKKYIHIIYVSLLCDFSFGLGRVELDNKQKRRSQEYRCCHVYAGEWNYREARILPQRRRWHGFDVLHGSCIGSLLSCVFAGSSAADGAAVALETCAGAVGFGDGRELFSLQAGGQIVNVAGGKCLGVRDNGAANGSEVILVACDKAPQWEVLANGQLKVNAADDLCLSQAGIVPGSVDVAAKAAVAATSTIHARSHGAPFFCPAIPCLLHFP